MCSLGKIARGSAEETPECPVKVGGAAVLQFSGDICHGFALPQRIGGLRHPHTLEPAVRRLQKQPSPFVIHVARGPAIDAGQFANLVFDLGSQGKPIARRPPVLVSLIEGVLSEVGWKRQPRFGQGSQKVRLARPFLRRK
jgi:hypothetical protein